jgi:hypothetical protein
VDHEIDVAQVDIAKVDRDLFGVARFVAKALYLSGHVAFPSIRMLYGCYMDGKWMECKGDAPT